MQLTQKVFFHNNINYIFLFYSYEKHLKQTEVR